MWVKKEGNQDFDVTMGGNDGVEISELVGLLMLSKLVHLFQDNSVGLYRDDWLGVLMDLPGPKTEKLKINVAKIFKDCWLSITSKTNLKIVDYLDVIFDLQNNSSKPCRKPDNLLVYIHKHSKHPPAILNKLPKSIAKRISDLSSSENIFHDAIPVYKEASQKSGFTSNLVYTPKQTDYYNNNEETKKRRRKIIWSKPHIPKLLKVILVKRFLI